MTNPAIDRATFNSLKETMGDDFVFELIDTYLEDSEKLMVDIERAFKGNDVEVFRRSAHSLKSTSASLGALTLSEVAKELEMMGKSEDLDGAGPKINQLSEEYIKVNTELKALKDGS